MGYIPFNLIYLTHSINPYKSGTLDMEHVK